MERSNKEREEEEEECEEVECRTEGCVGGKRKSRSMRGMVKDTGSIAQCKLSLFIEKKK